MTPSKDSPDFREGTAKSLEAKWCDLCKQDFNPYDQVHATQGLFMHPGCMERNS